MPFDFKKFDAKCAIMSIDELQREWEHYTRLISGSATSTAVSGAAIPFTLGISVIGVGLAAPAIHNARKKREIIERHLQRLGTTHHTRKRDVLTPMAISGTVGLVTLGVGSAGAGAITSAAVEHGITSVAANEMAVKATVHLAVHGVAMVGEEHHMGRKRLADAHNAQLKQQQEKAKVENTANINQSTIGSYDPSTCGHQPQTATNAWCVGDIKYEYSPVPIPPPVTESAPPPYSPLSHGGHQDYFSRPQGYSEHPDCNIAATPYSPSPSKFDTKAPYYASLSEPSQISLQLHPVQISARPATETSAYESTHYTQNIYSQPLVQQAPQSMYPSYPTLVMPDSAHQHYGRLDQVMSELSISAIPPPPQPQVNSAITPVQMTNSPSPTHRGYSYHLHQSPEQSDSYFPPPSPISQVSSTHYQQPTSTPCLSPITQHSTPATPFRSPSITSIGSYQPCPRGQTASFSQSGYMTPIPTPGSHYDQTQSQSHVNICNQYQTQAPPRPAQTPASYTNGHPTPAQTPSYLRSPTQYNVLQSPQSQPSYFRSPSSQPPPQAPIQGSWQSPSNANQGYPSLIVTPSYIAEQNNQPMYFPPPPTQPTK